MERLREQIGELKKQLDQQGVEEKEGKIKLQEQLKLLQEQLKLLQEQQSNNGNNGNNASQSNNGNNASQSNNGNNASQSNNGNNGNNNNASQQQGGMSLYDIIVNLVNPAARDLYANLPVKIVEYDKNLLESIEKIDNALIELEHSNGEFKDFNSKFYDDQNNLRDGFFTEIGIRKGEETEFDLRFILATILIIWNEFRTKFKILTIVPADKHLLTFNQTLTSLYVALDDKVKSILESKPNQDEEGF